jgi:hypothetical protein
MHRWPVRSEIPSRPHARKKQVFSFILVTIWLLLLLRDFVVDTVAVRQATTAESQRFACFELQRY